MKNYEPVYVTHTCKNSRKPEFIDDPKTFKKSKKSKIKNPEYCDRAFNAEDKTNVQDTPSTRLYCDECVKRGFKNPRTTTRTFTDEQRQEFADRMAKSRAEKKKS